MLNQELVPGEPDIQVCLIDNPSRRGTTTGKTKKLGTSLLIEVVFTTGNRKYKRLSALTRISTDNKSPLEILADAEFGTLNDLKRILTFEKINGGLTNVFYSMETSRTEYFPHQFRAVLNFIESTSGRLLIADEVGLGKTIEAIYIWKELQVREQARRLLVVCPAMLKEKWKFEFNQRFSINAENVDAKILHDRLSAARYSSQKEPLVCIASIEGLRPPSNIEDLSNQSIRAKLARLIVKHDVSEPLFDLVIFDEAQHLRNPATKNNHLCRLLNRASLHLLLLTATPIQMGSQDLYQLLRLIDSQEFFNIHVFDEILAANQPIVRAIKFLWSHPPDTKKIISQLDEALANSLHQNNIALKEIRRKILSETEIDKDKRIDYVKRLEMHSLLRPYMTRMRKREILQHRVKRKAQTLTVKFSEYERDVYRSLSKIFRQMSRGQTNFIKAQITLRQRQMTSSIVAALNHFSGSGATNLDEETLFEDIGIIDEFENILKIVEESDFIPLKSLRETIDSYDLKILEDNDSKYKELQRFISRQFRDSPKEKIVIFAYFRGTLNYLERRLKKTGFSVFLIMGGMGIEKQKIVNEFREESEPAILLSSEVGSEGIDLQFCRLIVNYDLPWNPMRVEQRIGRLDRLGQKSEAISIINMSLEDTIEDKVLLRLYERIKLFEESIGDLEIILGKQTNQLSWRLLDPKLEDDERQQIVNEKLDALENERKLQQELERNAINLVEYSDSILNRVKDSREKHRWLSAQELISVVDDFFSRYYPSTKFETDSRLNSAIKIQLSQLAQRDLYDFIIKTKPATTTRLDSANRIVDCHFDPRVQVTASKYVELIDTAHPLILWIAQYSNKMDSSYARDKVSAVKLKLDQSPETVTPGFYVYVIQKWSLKGIRTHCILKYCAVRLNEIIPLNASISEELVIAATIHGENFMNARNIVRHQIGDIESIKNTAELCDENLTEDFYTFLKDFEAENQILCEQQRTSAKNFHSTRISELERRIERFKIEGKHKSIPMTKGLLKREQNLLHHKINRIERQFKVADSLQDLAAGLIVVE